MSSTSMTYDAGSARMRIKKQQTYTRGQINDMSIHANAATFSFVNTAGPSLTVPFAAYANLFTNASGDFHPILTRLGSSLDGTKWLALSEGTKLKYEGDQFVARIYAHVTVRPNASDNRILALPVTGPGNGYTVAPTIAFSGDGTGATATAVLNLATQVVQSITIDVGGSGWGDAGTTASITGSPSNASVGTPTVVKATKFMIAVYKK